MADRKGNNPKIEEKSPSDEWSKKNELSLEEKYPDVTEMIQRFRKLRTQHVHIAIRKIQRACKLGFSDMP